MVYVRAPNSGQARVEDRRRLSRQDRPIETPRRPGSPGDGYPSCRAPGARLHRRQLPARTSNQTTPHRSRSSIPNPKPPWESPGCSCLVTTIRSARGFRCQLPRAPSSRPPGFHSSCASERPPAAARNPVPKRETEHENEQDIMVRQPSVVSRVWRATACPMQSQQRALVTGSEQRFFFKCSVSVSD